MPVEQRSHRKEGACLVAGALLAVAAIRLAGAPSAATGDVAAVERALRPADAAAESARRPAPRWQPNHRSLLGEATPSAPAPLPVRLRIPSLAVDAPVAHVGVDSFTGQMAVPDDPAQIGWYRFGPGPGEAGSAVLAGHVDVWGGRPGVFFHLDTLQLGDRVEVLRDDGESLAFSVEGRTTYRKDELPLDVVFSGQGDAVLTLITCGGRFDPAASRYDSNVVVFARPIAGTPPTPPGSA